MICKSFLELIDGNSSKPIVDNEIPLSSPQDKLLSYKKLLKDKFQYNNFKIDHKCMENRAKKIKFRFRHYQLDQFSLPVAVLTTRSMNCHYQSLISLPDQ